MPLDPALSDLLDKMAASAAYLRPAGTDLAGARRSHEADASRFTPPGQRAAIAEVRDTDIATPAGPLPARIYRPLSSAVPLPTVVWYHGGGWTTGSLETGDIVARALSAGTPAVVVSVAYRLSPEHPWPAATQDATAALQWTAAHIGQLGGDPERLAVGGDSAGGNLAAVAAQLARDSGPPLAAQILIYPVLDLDLDRSDRYPSLRDNADGYHVTRDELRWCVRNYLPASPDLADPRISPARHADLTGLPATVLAVAEYDPLRDQGTAYAEALRAASVPVTVHPGRGLIHGCFDMLGVTAAARDEIGRVLRSVRETLANEDKER
ncbi:MAG TPA: alpha/beta hydrolase [Streptosporangiaceae bacterium]|nr:alpha/beta hydrolase [Streptosporangiaceae bacterium]